MKDGLKDGEAVVGSIVGLEDGEAVVGLHVGLVVGALDGGEVGFKDGRALGFLKVGLQEGALVPETRFLSSNTFLVLSDGKIFETKEVEKEKEKIFLLSQIRFLLDSCACFCLLC